MTIAARCALLAAAIGVVAGCGGGGSATTPNPVTAGASVDSIVLSLDSASIIIGDTMRMVAIARDAAGKTVPGVLLVWTSSDPSVATVSSSGLVTAVGFGEADIEVEVVTGSTRLQSGTESALLFASRRSRSKIQSVPTIVITPGSSTVDIGANVEYSARLVDKFNTQLSRYPVIKWTSSAPAVATIDQNGRATAVARGTTSIGASVTFASGNGALPVSVPLQVAVCGGMLDLTSWTATLSTSYTVVNKVLNDPNGSELTFNISQSSQGTASLRRTYLDTQTNETRWEGVVSGTANVNNRVVQRLNNESLTYTDIGNGPLVSLYAIIRLVARWSQADGCKYTLKYDDGLLWTHTDAGGAGSYSVQATAAIAQFVGIAGPMPAGGWRLASAPDLPAMLVDWTTADPAGQGLIPVFYSPLTPVAEALLELVGGSNTFGTGKFTFTLVGQ